MANQDSKSFVETIVEAQKQMVDTVTENTRKFANGNNVVNESIDKGSEWYKNWLENQKSVFGQTTEKATAAAGNIQENAGKATEFYQNWMKTQMDTAKNIWETTLNQLKNVQQQATGSNPMEQMTSQWNNWMSNMGNMSNWMNNMNQFQNQFQNANPFSMNTWKSASDNMSNVFNQWSEMLNGNFSEFTKNFQNGTAQDAYRNMLNTTEGFTRFYEMWSPMWKSIQDKTFNMEQYKQFMNPAMYKEFMDKFFSFMPDQSRQYFNQISETMQNGARQMFGQNAGGMQQFRQMMGNMMPVNGSELFGSMLSNYTNAQDMFQSAMSPITRMMTPNQHTKNMAEWQDIANRMMVYNIKNAELQYMIYTQGTKVMDALAENVSNKIQHGEEVASMMALYQEWMSISDKTFVSLFESEAYSQLMAEVSSLQLKLRKDMEAQVEKQLANLPIATRSEMDEMYKTIYELKKEIRQLEKMMEIEPIGETATATTPAATAPVAQNEATAADAAAKSGNSRSKKA
jgi:hypothetical protein